MRTAKHIDAKRLDWDKSDNILRYYKNLMELLLRLGYAVRNTGDDSLEQPIKIHKRCLDLIVEFDEIGFDLTASGSARSTALQTVGPIGSTVEVCIDQSNSAHISGMGGTTAGGKPLRPMFVFSSGATLDVDWTRC
jgi:hypothetical protein